jgi:hypothetical protein
MTKYVEPRPFADPEVAAWKLMEIANSVEPVQDGRIHTGLINWPMPHDLKATPAEYKARPRPVHRARLALAARKRHLSEIHRQRCGLICLNSANGLQYS